MPTLRLASLLALGAGLAGLSACALDDLASGDQSLADGTPEAVGVLRFLNGPAATLSVLDVDVALDVRAARNIVAHVRGDDGDLGTGDDDLLDDVAELDAIAYVGPATLQRLVDHVDSIGGVPRIDADGVLLTDAEAAAIVAAANGATLDELDVTAALDARAARNLVAARPLPDIAAVAAVTFVGPAALEKLRRWAPTWSGGPAPQPEPEPEPEPEPVPPADCAVSLTYRGDAAVSDFDQLLFETTTWDYPYAQVIALQAPACLDLDATATRAALVEALRTDPRVQWSFGPSVRPTAGAATVGGSGFVALVDDARDGIENRYDAGIASPQVAALYARLPALHAALTAGPTASPTAYLQASFVIPAEECTERGYALIDRTDHRVWFVHRFPLC